MTEKTCKETLDFQSYVDQQMTLPERVKLEKHVRDCSACARELDSHQAFFSDLQAACSTGQCDLPTSLDINRTMSRIAKAYPDSTSSTENSIGGWIESLGLAGFGRVAMAGAALLLVLAFTWMQGIPTSPTARPVTRPVTPLAALPNDNLFSFSLSAPAKYSLAQVGNPAIKMPGKGLLQRGVLYHLPSFGKLYVTYKNENRLEFSNEARFEISAPGVQLFTGDLWCRFQKSGHDLVIKTPNGTVTALGTKFYVEVTPHSTRISLEDGQIILRTSSTTVSMKRPGTLFLMNDGSIISQSEPREYTIQVPESHLPVSPRTFGENPPADTLPNGY